MITPIILAGGSGTRLWPISRSSFPKQFQKLHGDNTLFQNTILRLKGLEANDPLIICNGEHRFIVQKQLDDLGITGEIIIEPESKNTAPAVALAAHFSISKENDDLLLILAADHSIKQEDKFNQVIKESISLAEDNKIVTYGINPTFPNTGYGYIELGNEIEGSGCFEVKQFKEKPNKIQANDYLDSGNFMWNSGIFLSKSSVLLEELNNYESQIYNVTKDSLDNSRFEDNLIFIDKETFSKCKNESIDNAIMEKTNQSVVCLMEVDWSDLGSWNSLSEIDTKDSSGNTLIGEIDSNDNKNCYIRSENRFISAIGLEDLVIIDSKDALLVASKNKTEEVKRSEEYLKTKNKSEWSHHATVYRPWGRFDSIEKGETFQVKKIIVNPKERLSLQKHNHRAEHWIVVSGVAKVTREDETFLLHKNESTYIPQGSKHSLENLEEEPLVLIEVQSGSYLREDDIERFEDKYGRD